MRKWIHHVLKGASLTAALFVFQACYGTPPAPYELPDDEGSAVVDEQGTKAAEEAAETAENAAQETAENAAEKPAE